MEVTWNHYYNIVCKIASLAGMWPNMKPKLKRLATIAMVISMITMLIPLINYQLKCKSDLQCTIRSITSYVAPVISLIKVSTFKLNSHTIENLIHHLFEDWKLLKTAKEYEIMASYAKTARQYCLIYFAYSMLAVLAFMSMTLIPYSLDILLPLNESRPVLTPYYANWFVDFREYFFLIYLHSVVTGECIISGLVAHDCLLMTFIEHVCSLFSVVGYRFEYLFHDCNTEVVDINSNDIYRERIALLVHTHRHALEYAQLLEKTCTISFVIQVFIVVVALSTTFTQALKLKSSVLTGISDNLMASNWVNTPHAFPNSPSQRWFAVMNAETDGILELIRYVVLCIGQLFHLFYLSFEGQKLIDHSVQIREKIYSSLWYNASTKSRKLLVLLMMKGLRPSFISAGKIYIFCLESFAMVLQTSMSYCTILATI